MKYAADVCDGTIPSSKYTIRACERALLNHSEEASDDFEFYFDANAVDHVCGFIEMMPHIKSTEYANKLIDLQPWQCFIEAQVFGWKVKDGYRKGRRRFRKSYIEVGRGNGKSTLSSPNGIYMAVADGEGGAEVYSCATSKDQAIITFSDAQSMARHPLTRELMNKLGVQVNAKSITRIMKSSKFVALSADSHTLDGLNIHMAIIDELHAHKTRALYDVIETGAGKRQNSLVWCITTAGSDRSGICYEQREYLLRVLNGSVEDDSMFGCIWTADDDDHWNDINTWKKANPNWGISVDPSYITNLAKKAATMPAAINNFKTKHLNIWVNADNPWMNMEAWDRCKDENLTISDFKGEDCYIGLDLATTTDVAAKVYIFPKTIENEIHYYCFGTYYVPRSTVESGVNSQYSGWEILTYLTVTEGNVNDFSQIEEELVKDMTDFNVLEVAYDPWQSAQLSQKMLGNGAKMIEYRNNTGNMSAPMKRIEEYVLSSKFHHNDPVMTWMASNVVCHYDLKDNIFPRKARPENKIDGIVAAIFAVGRLMANEMAESVYFSRGLITF